MRKTESTLMALDEAAWADLVDCRRSEGWNKVHFLVRGPFDALHNNWIARWIWKVRQFSSRE